MNIKDITLWTALVTPMKSDGSVDYPGLEAIIRRQESAGNGILLMGSTGEGLALGDDEKVSIVKFVSELNPETPVMVGVGGFNLEKQSQWIQTCNHLNIDAFLLVSPLYSKPGPIGMEQWFRSLLDVSDKPCMLYNIPGRTGIEIPPAVIQKLYSHKNMWSLKEASGDISDYRAFRNAAPDLPIFSGDDKMLPVFVEAGCNGLVSVASNVWPQATKRYVELSLKQQTSTFEEVWPPAIRALFSVSNPIPVKVLMVEKGWFKSSALRLPLTSRELIDKGVLFEADEIISNWYSNHKQKIS
jgi:4-hydroxy-tetrahydrodipicolinate synthase